MKGRFEIIEPKRKNPDNIPPESIVKRPWGYYRMFAENVECTVKVLYIGRNQKLSLQFHKIRDQVYFIIDPLTVYLSDEPVPEHMYNDMAGLKAWCKAHVKEYSCKPGTVVRIPKFVVHRPFYRGQKDEGIMLDLAFNWNFENDIVRVEDLYGRK